MLDTLKCRQGRSCSHAREKSKEINISVSFIIGCSVKPNVNKEKEHPETEISGITKSLNPLIITVVVVNFSSSRPVHQSIFTYLSLGPKWIRPCFYHDLKQSM